MKYANLDVACCPGCVGRASYRRDLSGQKDKTKGRARRALIRTR